MLSPAAASSSASRNKISVPQVSDACSAYSLSSASSFAGIESVSSATYILPPYALTGTNAVRAIIAAIRIAMMLLGERVFFFIFAFLLTGF